MVAPLKHGPWKLSDINDVPKNGLKVFSCFHCGGGSTMGYKLAGYDVLGGVEIDPEMMNIYRANHNPKHSYLMGVQQFKNIPDEKLPPELFNLDILDGSPPCSSFSMAGKREKKWGKEHHFREGQAKQILDDLFFDYIAIAKKLQPKIVLAENVKGLILGNARGYVKQIFAAFRDAGYEPQLFLLNAARMGVPQRRERTFFIAYRNDLKLKKLRLDFNEKPIALKEVFTGKTKASKKSEKRFGDVLCNMNLPIQTITTLGRYFVSNDSELMNDTIIRLQSFPEDYDWQKTNPKYLCGMSVPPYMMQRIAIEIHKQFFDSVMK